MALDLFRFMESFNKGVSGDTLILPTNCLELWFQKFDAKFKRWVHLATGCHSLCAFQALDLLKVSCVACRNPEFLMQSGEKMPG